MADKKPEYHRTLLNAGRSSIRVNTRRGSIKEE